MSLLRLPNSVEISVIRPQHLTAAVTHTSPVVECVDYLEMTTFTGAVQERAGAEYYQRPASIDLSLVCTAQSMTVTLKTEETFTGRLFAQDTGRDCQILGTARTETKLSFYFEPSAAAKYGVERGERGVFEGV